MTSTSVKTTGPEPSRMTLEEFLAWDGGGHVGKLELWEGIVRAMAPASAVHAIIEANIGTSIINALRVMGKGWLAAIRAPIVPPMGRRRNARAPDVSVTCSPPSPEGTFESPVLIVDVISPGNENQTWDSIESLAGHVSLQEILVVQSTRIETELFRRDARGAWPREGAIAGPNGTVELKSIDLVLPVADIYEGTSLA